MNKKYLILLIICLVLWVVNSGFSDFSTFGLVNLSLVLLLYLFIDNYDFRVWWLLGAVALLGEIVNPLNFGFIFILHFLVAWIIYILGSSVFTNRSFYTIMFLTLLGSFTYKLGLSTVVIFNNLSINWPDYIAQIWLALMWEVIFMSLLYIIVLKTIKNKIL